MQKFKFITHDIHDAYFNLASEEYLLKHTDGFYFYLWINDPAVIVGTNQNAIEEVNFAFTEQNKIKVVRRLTGGGAVYHDRGNLCYTVIAPYSEEENLYKKFTTPVIEYLNELGVNAQFSGRNDITVEGRKISGNAQTVFNDRIMHHGTLLFNTDLEGLQKSLIPNKLKMQSKGIKSIRARVANISEFLSVDMSIEEFKNGLAQKLLYGCENYVFSDADKLKIATLMEEKYSRYEWNIGRSPKGENVFEHKFSFGVLKITFDTQNGVMQNVEISGDFFSMQDVGVLENKLCGIKLKKADLTEALKDVDKFINGATALEIVDVMFN